MRTATILSFCIVIIMQSCSIEKRHYNKGFHVQWHHKDVPVQQPNRYYDQEARASTMEKTENPIKTTDSVLTTSSSEDNSDSSIKPETKKSQVLAPRIKPSTSTSIQVPRSSSIGGMIGHDTPVKHKGAKNSLTFGLIPYLVMIAGIMNLYGVIFISAPIGGVLFIAALIFSILAIAIGKNAKTVIDNNPGKFSNRSDAAAGSILGLVYLLLLLIAIALFILILIAFGGI